MAAEKSARRIANCKLSFVIPKCRKEIGVVAWLWLLLAVFKGETNSGSGAQHRLFTMFRFP